jgi:hypothetical protein
MNAAVQESFEVWGKIFKEQSVDKVLELCVGDSIGAPTRKAFPKTKDELLKLKKPDGAKLYEIARDYLKAVEEFYKPYMTAWKQGKFCHAFGIFQYDIQYFKKDPAYFLQKRWSDFDVCCARDPGAQNCAEGRQTRWQENLDRYGADSCCDSVQRGGEVL